MNDYEVTITETLVKKVSVKAESLANALEVVEEMHECEDVVLDASDFVDVNYNVVAV
jgi:hypothetical protein